MSNIAMLATGAARCEEVFRFLDHPTQPPSLASPATILRPHEAAASTAQQRGNAGMQPEEAPEPEVRANKRNEVTATFFDLELSPDTYWRRVRPPATAVKAARLQAGLTHRQAAQVIHAGQARWLQWESGTRRMDRALWEYWLVQTNLHPLLSTGSRKTAIESGS